LIVSNILVSVYNLDCEDTCSKLQKSHVFL